MQHERVTPFAGLGRRAAAASFVAFLAGALPLAAQQKSDAAIKSDIELARGLAADWQYVDLAEGVIEDLESGSLPDELASEVALVKCEIYAVGARRESDADRREELYTKAIDAYRDFIDKNPLSDVLPEAQRGYVDVCNQAALKMADRLPEATGEEAEELRREINGVLEEALKYTSDLKDDLRQGGTEWPLAMRGEWARVMFARGQMYHTMARIADDGTFFYTQAIRTLEELASVIGETTPAGLTAYIELASVYMSQGDAQTAADFTEFVVNTAYPKDAGDRAGQGFDDLTAEDKAKRWIYAERGTGNLTEAMLQSGRTEAAVEWSLHYYNTWKQEGFTLSPQGYVSLLAVARTLLDTGGYIGGNTAIGNLRWYETTEEMESNTSRRERRTALDLALSIAQTVNTDNRGNILQVRAQKLIADVISRPGVQVSPEVLFEAAQGEHNNGNYAAAIDGLKRVMRSIDRSDEAMRLEYGGKVSFYLGESFRKQDRMLEAAMAYREGAAQYGADAQFAARNAKNFSTAVSELRSKAAGVQEFEDMRAEADRFMLDLTEDIDDIVLRQAKSIYDKGDYAAARKKYQEVPEGSPVKEKAITYAALCLEKLNDHAGAAREFEEYLNVWITDPTHQATSPKAVGTRKEARAMATYYLGKIAFEAADYDEAVKWLDRYYETFPDQTSYAPPAQYMVVLSHLAQMDLDQVRAAHAKMVELYPDQTRTGIAATRIFNALLSQREAADKAGDTERSMQLAREMANYIQIGNQLDSNPNFSNLRTESSLWMELDEHQTAEAVLRQIIKRFESDPDQQESLNKFVKPDLGEVLLAQNRAQEAFDVLNDLVPKPDDEADPRKPSSRVVELWCKSVCGWVETEDEGRKITPVPGVGGAEQLADACKYWGKLTDMEARDHKWELPWYERYFETAYGYYQWGQVDSERLDAARAQLEVLRTELGEDLGLIEDEGLKRRFQWLYGKLR